MKTSVIAFAATLLFTLSAQAKNEEIRHLSDKEIDAQLKNMQEMLPVDIQSGIKWVDIKRHNREINYTYIVNANSADWSERDRIYMLTRLQDFGCRQLLPAMCEGLQVMFASGLTATTTYHDSFGNYLFACTFTPEVCRPLETKEEN